MTAARNLVAVVVAATAVAAAGGGEPRPLAGHTQDVLSVAFSPDGRRLATTSLDRTLRVWDLSNGKSVVIDFKYAVSRGVAFSPDGKHLAGKFQNKVGVWDAVTWAAVAELTFDSSADGAAARVAYSPDGATLAVGHERGLVRLWDVATRRPVFERLDPGWKKKNSNAFHSLAFSPDGRLLLVGYDDTAQVWDVATRAVVQAVGGGTGLDPQAGFWPGGRHFYLKTPRGFQSWDAATGTAVDGVTRDDRPDLIAPLTDATLFGSTRRADGTSRTLGLYDCKAGPVGGPLATSREPVTAVAVSRDGKLAAYAAGKAAYVLPLPPAK
ncbi:MAG TPA: hypothetical protein VH092_12740 [Urbifossiella sp.]|jgi:WD40 repeat protein|nr:hypothetical protein [Urbifossiella sp.]